MEILIAFLLLCLVGAIIGVIVAVHYAKKTIADIKANRVMWLEQQLRQEALNKVQSLHGEVAQLEDHKKRLNQEIQEKTTFNEQLYKSKEEEMERLVASEKAARVTKMESELAQRLDQVANEVADWAKSAQEAEEYQQQLRIKDCEEELKLFTELIEDKSKEFSEIYSQIEDYRKKRDAVNQDILRNRAVEEQQDFYRIQLTPEAIRDITVLEEVRPRLSKIDLLDKLIYDNYIKKPVDEMIKRVLEGRAPCGIYKITRLKTGEIYIGKSTDIKARWQQHTKSAFHCGTISHSILHTTMEKDGIENFTFELVEEVEKDKLSAQEKFWINFYDSKKYGLNEREG